MNELWIKICGIRDEESALAALEAGADAIGFVFADSPRRVDAATARRIVERVRAAEAAGSGRKPAGHDGSGGGAPGQAARMEVVGVFVNAPVAEVIATARAVGLTHVQLHGDEPDADVAALRAAGMVVIKAVGVAADASVPPATALGTPADLVLLDRFDPRQRGGTGRTFDWTVAAAVARRRPVIVAGGLAPENVAEAVRVARPWGVDVSSGVERARGVKDPALIARFVRTARLAWEEVRAAGHGLARHPAAGIGGHTG
ncbi:MAG TPA: phosphoribosylanthranilate isomerase [Thermaerobacter sp.]